MGLSKATAIYVKTFCIPVDYSMPGLNVQRSVSEINNVQIDSVLVPKFCLRDDHVAVFFPQADNQDDLASLLVDAFWPLPPPPSGPDDVVTDDDEDDGRRTPRSRIGRSTDTTLGKNAKRRSYSNGDFELVRILKNKFESFKDFKNELKETIKLFKEHLGTTQLYDTVEQIVVQVYTDKNIEISFFNSDRPRAIINLLDDE